MQVVQPLLVLPVPIDPLDKAYSRQGPYPAYGAHIKTDRKQMLENLCVIFGGITLGILSVIFEFHDLLFRNRRQGIHDLIFRNRQNGNLEENTFL